LQRGLRRGRQGDGSKAARHRRLSQHRRDARVERGRAVRAAREASAAGATPRVHRRHGLTHRVRPRAYARAAPISAHVVLQAGRDHHVMRREIDQPTVRRFIEIINEHVKKAINGAGKPGFLQLCRINPFDDKSVVPSRFEIGDVELMVETAVGDATAGHNVYLEARTVREGLRGNKRGGLEDTARVFGLVADCDADKDRGGDITVKPSLAVETSPGNFQLWYLFTHAILAEQARAIGDAIRTSSGTDQDTGVITQCYRVPGTPNFPSRKKQARGRITVEPTRIFEY